MPNHANTDKLTIDTTSNTETQFGVCFNATSYWIDSDITSHGCNEAQISYHCQSQQDIQCDIPSTTNLAFLYDSSCSAFTSSCKSQKNTMLRMAENIKNKNSDVQISNINTQSTTTQNIDSMALNDDTLCAVSNHSHIGLDAALQHFVANTELTKVDKPKLVILSNCINNSSITNLCNRYQPAIDLYFADINPMQSVYTIVPCATNQTAQLLIFLNLSNTLSPNTFAKPKPAQIANCYLRHHRSRPPLHRIHHRY